MSTVEATGRPIVGAVEQRSASATLDAPAAGRTLVGYAALFNVESQPLGSGWTEVVAPGAFDGVLGDDVRLTFAHDPEQVLARTTSGTLALTVDDRGLRFEATLGDGPTAADVRDRVARGDVTGTSFRFVVAPGGERWDGDRRTITHVERLLDVCVTADPAYLGPEVELRSRHEAADMSKEGPSMGTEQIEATKAPNTNEENVEQVEQRSAPSGGLRVESRNLTDDAAGSVADRMAEAARSVERGESRSLTAANAGALLPVALDKHVWDRMREASVFLASGVQIVTATTASVRLPRITADADAEFLAQAAAIDPSDPTLSELEVTPKALKSLVYAASEVVDDSDPSVLKTVQDHLLAVHASRLDAEFINGAATSNPNGFAGLLNTAGIKTLDGSTLELWAAIAAAAGALRAAGATNPVALVHPWAVTGADLTRDASGATAGTGGWLARPASLPPIFESAALPVAGDDTAPALVYDAARVVVVRRQDTIVEVDRSAEWGSDQVAIRARTRAALGVPHPGAVVKVTGLDAVDPLD